MQHLKRALWTIVVLLGVTCGFAATVVTSLKVDPDIAGSLRNGSDVYADFARHRSVFGNDARDVVLAVQSDGVLPLDAVETLVIDLQLTPGVVDVMSIFTLPSVDEPGRSLLGSDALQGASDAQKVAAVLAASPLAEAQLAPSGDVTLLVVLMAPDVPAPGFDDVLAEALALAPPELSITRVGPARLEQEVLAGLARDQTTITPAAMLLSLILVAVIFRGWRAPLICGLPVVCALVIFLGGLAVTGTAMTPILSLVPVIVIVLGFSDAVHYVYAIARHAQAPDPVATAGAEVRPAIVFTTATTVVAFLVMLSVDSDALHQLAWAGAYGMVAALVCVSFGVPALARLVLRQGATVSSSIDFGRLARGPVAALKRWRALSLLAVVTLIGLAAFQPYTVIGDNPFEHIPRGSNLAQDIATLDAKIPGSGRHYVLVEAADPEPGVQAADAARLGAVAQAFFGAPLEVPLAGQDAVASPGAARFAAPDGSLFALPVPTSLLQTPASVQRQVGQLRAALAQAGLDDVARVTGYPIMAATQMPAIVTGLKQAFYITIVLMTFGTWAVLRSLPLAVASLVPNFMPILAVEAWIVATGQVLTVTGAVAFVVAFGIAVDNTIHMLNRFRLGAGHAEVIEDTIRALMAPICTTSALLLAGFALTVFSALPAVSLFGALTLVSLSLAVLADLLLFPSVLVGFKKMGWI